MANKKISSLNSLGGTPDVADIIPITDVSDTTGSVNGTTKKVTVANLVAAAPQGDLVASNNLSDVASASTARTNLGLGTAATSASTDFSSAFFSIVSETTTARTLSDSDNGKVIICSNSGQITVTIPGGLTSGFGCTIVQNGTGVVIIEGSGGASVNGFGGKTSTAGQYGSINVYNTGTNTYVLEGDTQSPPFVNTYSLDFDGSNDYVDAGSSPSALTIEGLSVWFRPDVAYGSGTMSFLLGFGGSDIGIALGGDYFGPVSDEVITVCNSNHLWSYTGSGVTISANTWHHLGIRWESSSSATNSGNAGYDIYLDGTKVGNSFGTYTSGTGSKATTQRFTAGARNRSGAISQFYNGEIDEFAVFSSAVSESDLLAMYNSGGGAIDLASYSPGLWWRMGDNDSGTGTTITDQGVNSSGNPTGNDGTINGATFVQQTP